MKKTSSIIYFFAMVMSCIGMSISFLGMNQESSLLRIAVVLTLAFFLYSLVHISVMKRHDAIVVFSIIVAILIVVVKMIYFEQYYSIAPLMLISNFLIIMVLIFGRFEFSFGGYILINIVGSIALIVGILTNSHSTWGAVQIGYINPQTIGSWALIYAIGAMLSYDYFVEHVKHKGLFLLCELFIYGFMIYIAAITQSRFALIIMICLLIVRLIPPMSLFNNQMMRVVIVLFPILFLLLSQFLYVLGVFNDMDGGSLLNGREQIWADVFEQVLSNPLLGISYNTINANTFYSHNIFVDYCALFGFLVAIIFLISLCYIVVRKIPAFKTGKYKHEKGKRLRYDAYVSFCLVIVGASIEGSFFSVGAGGLYIFTYGLLLMAASRDKNCFCKCKDI